MLYLPLVGLCLMFGVAVGSFRRPRMQWIVIVLLIAYHWAALRHNLALWRSVADLADSVCAEIVSAITPGTTGVLIRELPGSINGVYFLRNGLGGCLDRKAGRALGLRILDDKDLDAPQPSGVLVLRWADLDARASSE